MFDILQKRKQRTREVKGCAQGYKINEWKREDQA